MTDLRYEAPESLNEAVALVAGGGRVLAGGTDVLVLMHSEMMEPELLVDVKRIPELREIVEEEGAWRIGAAVPGMAVVDHDGFSASWPGVVEGVALIGSVQIKGRATVGGNLCNASPAADSVPALIAAGAAAEIAGPSGRRREAVENVVTGPGRTSLADGEIVASFRFPPRPPRAGDCYLRLTPRTEMDIAVVGAGVNVVLDGDGVCAQARIALGAVAPTPLLVADAAAALIGTRVDAAALDDMVAACRAACDPISDKRGTREYRIRTAGVIARRAAEKALARARSSGEATG